MIGCDCRVCMSDDTRNHRSRPSVMVSYGEHNDGNRPHRLLIDTTPELRLQMTRHRIDRIDGVLYTHSHADHVFGLDDLRRFNAVMEQPLDVYAEPPVIDWLKQTFTYVFEPSRNVNKSFIPNLIAQPLEPGASVDMFGATWTPLRLLHGRLPILGFRVDLDGASLAYCTDVSSFPPETYPLISDLDVLVIDALRFRHHPTHLTVDQALEVIDQVKPKQAYLTHIAHEIEHAEVDTQLPDGVNLAFDSLCVDVSDLAARVG